jgi:hypothetical protein
LVRGYLVFPTEMTRGLAIIGWIVAAMAMCLARYSIDLAAEAAAEAREAQLISCELIRTQGRLLGWEVDNDCSALRKTAGVWPKQAGTAGSALSP